ncbi:hypothetical protein KKC97_09225 [bacterium]|nr:hypothetical protein [bacterium]MBU1637832.1 hypothetical protein [bacterium]MBU1919703.1 hypothetical protein [bacterium]
MFYRRTLPIAILVVLAVIGFAIAADNDTHEVTVTVSAINEMAVSGGDIGLTINSATAGAQPDDDTDATTGLAWTTNEATKKITAETDNAAPTYTLKVLASAVTGGGAAAAQVTLSTTPGDYVTGIGETIGTCTNTYTASATAAQGTGADVHNVTFTITAE